jgi:hypothetical protein
VRFIVLGVRIRQQYRELHDEAYDMDVRDKLRYQRGDVADPTLGVILAKSERQRICAKFGRRIAGVERLLTAISDDLATALTSEGPEPEYVEETQHVSAAERERIHRQREDDMRSA